MFKLGRGLLNSSAGFEISEWMPVLILKSLLLNCKEFFVISYHLKRVDIAFGRFVNQYKMINPDT